MRQWNSSIYHCRSNSKLNKHCCNNIPKSNYLFHFKGLVYWKGSWKLLLTNWKCCNKKIIDYRKRIDNCQKRVNSCQKRIIHWNKNSHNNLHKLHDCHNNSPSTTFNIPNFSTKSPYWKRPTTTPSCNCKRQNCPNSK